ncbi:26S proteasome regulatory subunit [Hortaea werneckii]|nr:26S proteasome regulatory subunit [Hortaea werneckii]KAI7324943.1 26S proteasome regulatory subunit [Hortaea werneckii]
MANDEPKAQDKGKGKAEEKQVNGASKDGQKDGKKKEGELEINPEEELSEEDQKLKEELDMLVERLTENDKSLYKPALEAIKTNIKTSTSSMTAVPKPLKFLRPHYEKLCETYEKWPDSEEKRSLADTLSVLGMTYSDDEERRDTLKYRLLAPSEGIGSWGHEYMRHLALEIGSEYQHRLDEEQDTEDLAQLTRTLVPFYLAHNAEADAVDILSELEMIDEIKEYLDENTYSRVCLYMVSMVPLLTYPDNDRFVRTAHDIYVHYKQLTQAMSLAIKLNDMDLIKADFAATKDKALKRQLAFILGRQRICLDLEGEDAEDPELQDCINNTKLPEHFKSLAKELNILDPKVPEDIYKSHLESSRTAGMTNTDSARHNLASAFVNAFVNAGFGEDKLMLVEGGVKQSWIWKVKEDGMISTAASAGMLMLWDVEMGLDKMDAYTYVPEDQIKAGAALGMGVMNSGVRLDSDPTMALLGDLEGKSVAHKMASIMGLGLAYAGSQKEDLLELLLPYVSDTSVDMQLSAMAALSLGLIFVGSAQSDVSEAIIQTFLDEDRTNQLKDKWTRFMTLGLALLFFGQQEEVDVVLETLKAIDHPMSKPASVLAEICAWTGTGAVLKLQQLLHICNEHIEEKEEKEGDDKKEEGEEKRDLSGDMLVQAYAVIGLSLVAMGEEVGQDMVLRQFGHLMHYGEANIRKAVPLAMGLISPSNPQMKVYDTLSRFSHDNDIDVAVNAIFAMGILGAGTNNARLAQLLRQLASYYHRDANALFMVRIAQGLLHMGKGTMSINPFHTDRSVMSRVGAAGLLTVAVSLIDNPKAFILGDHHYLLYFLVTAMHPRFLITLDEDLKPVQVNVRVGQAVDVVGQAGRPKTITGWQTQSTPVLLGYGERAELEDEEWICMANVMEGICILRKRNYESELPTFTTDVRMNKPIEIFSSSSGHAKDESQAKGSGGGGPCEAVWWIKGDTMVQWRMKGEAFIVGDDIEGEGEQSKESSGVRTAKSEIGSRMRVVKEEGRDQWSWKRELVGHFGNISPGMRGSFKNPPPGQPVDQPYDTNLKTGEKVTTLDDPVSRSNFRVVVIKPEEVESTDLSDPVKARRQRYTYDKSTGKWTHVETWP